MSCLEVTTWVGLTVMSLNRGDYMSMLDCNVMFRGDYMGRLDCNVMFRGDYMGRLDCNVMFGYCCFIIISVIFFQFYRYYQN